MSPCRVGWVCEKLEIICQGQSIREFNFKLASMYLLWWCGPSSAALWWPNDGGAKAHREGEKEVEEGFYCVFRDGARAFFAAQGV